VTAGTPGGYGLIRSADTRSAACSAGTISVRPKNASRGSITLSSWISAGDGKSICGGRSKSWAATRHDANALSRQRSRIQSAA